LIQSGPREFTACFPEDARPYKEHVVNLLPCWENQILKVREAFGRETMLDADHPSKDDVICVKSVDDSPPDPTSERIMTYTLGDDPKEYQFRVHGGDTPALIREWLKRIHPGKTFGPMMFEGGEMDDDELAGDWVSRTGTSDWKVSWKMGQAKQVFQLWTTDGVRDIGEEVIQGRSYQEVWQDIRAAHPGLENFEDYQMFIGQDPVQWSDLPRPGVVLVPKVIPQVDRGIQFRLVDANAVVPPREVGPLVRASWQVFTAEKSSVCETVQVDIPNEITLAQLVAAYIIPSGFDHLDSNTIFFWTLDVISDPSKADKTKKTVVQIPAKIPPGFNLRVMANTLHENSTGRKQVASNYRTAQIRSLSMSRRH
jgi:hypothetical protein